MIWGNNWRGSLGLEPSPELYVEHIVEIFAEVKRVLRDDGTLWLNIGDSYWGGKGRSGYELPHEAEERRAKGETLQHSHNVPGYMDMRPADGKHPIFKPKDLLMIPAMVALALQANGWWLRSEITWCKLNSMPESVTDRPSTATEKIYLLAKSKKYYYDQEAVREPNTNGTLRRLSSGPVQSSGDNPKNLAMGRWYGKNIYESPTGRNMRNWLAFPTQAWPEAHFATFPTRIPEIAILAGTSEHGCCPCGAPYERVVERKIKSPTMRDGEWEVEAARMGIIGTEGRQGRRQIGLDRKTALEKNPGYTTLGWQRTCFCEDAEPVPAVALDIFGGAGTSGLVANRLGRDALLIELSEEYCEMARKRILNDAPLFNEVTIEN